MSISDDLALLTQGAVFLNKKGRTAKLLFVTNTSLPAKVQVAHVPQVVYVNEEGDVFNRDLDNFIETYKFYNVDPELEQRLENLFIFSDKDPVHDAVAEEDAKWLALANEARSEGHASAEQVKALLSQETGRVTDTDVHQSNVPKTASVEINAPTVKVQASNAAEDALLLPPNQEKVETVPASPVPKAALQVLFGTLKNSIELAPELNKLSSALIAYAQDPDLTQSLIVHRLTFALDSDLTIAKLQELFRPCDEESDVRNTVDLFDVQTTDSSNTIVWTSYIGVFPEFTKHGLYATVMVGTDEIREVPQTGLEQYVHAGPAEGTETTAPVDESLTITLPEVKVAGEVVDTVLAGDTVSQNSGRAMMHLEVPGNVTPEQIQKFVEGFQSADILHPDVTQLFDPAADPVANKLFSPSNDTPGAL